MTNPTENVIDWSRFSKYERRIKVVVFRLRFRSKQTGIVTALERQKSKLLIFQLTQRERFADLFSKPEDNTGEKVKHDLAKLSPFVDSDNTIRVRARLNNATLSKDLKHPIFRSAKHPAVVLMLRQMHEDNQHGGTEYVRSLVQQKFWVVGIRNAMRSIKSKYVKCRKLAVQRIHPHMAVLLKKRVWGKVYPFKSTGIDYFGSIEVSVLRRPVKHWWCLFTCLVTRAVHIELVNGLDTDSCKMAVTRFMARRSKPHTIISDNGTNSVGAAREFKDCVSQWDRDAICELRARSQIIWKFNPPGAPHFGGIWERLVRSCKKAMFAILGNRRLKFPVLTTTMCLVEQTLNTRPLTPVSDDPKDLEALTFNHFLLGRPVIAEPLMPVAVRYVDCRKMCKMAQAYNQMIWNRWSKQYLPKWNLRSKWATDDERVLEVGDLVWLIDESVGRHENKMARVMEVYPGADGVIRSTSINTADGVLRRPPVKLAPVFYKCFRVENRAGNVSARDAQNYKS